MSISIQFLKKMLIEFLGVSDVELVTSSRYYYASKMEPDGAAVTVTGAAGALSFGSWTEIDAATDAGQPIVITAIILDAPTGKHHVALGYGAGGSEVEFARIFGASGGYYKIAPKRIPRGTRIAARTKTVAGGAQATGVLFEYHTEY